MISVQASLREILREAGLTAEGTSSDRGTVLRSESDSGEKSSESDGNGSRRIENAADRAE